MAKVTMSNVNSLRVLEVLVDEGGSVWIVGEPPAAWCRWSREAKLCSWQRWSGPPNVNSSTVH